MPKVTTKVASPKFLNYKESSGLTVQYTIQTVDSEEQGTLQIPIAGRDGAACRIVKTSAKYAIRTYVWTATRWGLPPLAPSEETSNKNEVFLRKDVGNVTPQLLPSGVGFIYTLSGSYVYALTVPEDTQPIPTPPHFRNVKKSVTKADFTKIL